MCVCQTYVLTAKTTTFNGTLTVDRAALLPVFLFVCTSEGKAFLLCHTEGLRAENNCSSLGRGDIRDFCRGVFGFLWLRKSPDLKNLWGGCVTGDTEDGRGIVSGVNEKIAPPPQRHTHIHTPLHSHRVAM